MSGSRREYTYRAAVLAGRALFGALRLRRTVLGIDRLPAGPALLAVTHFSYLDFALVEWAVWRRDRRLVRYLVTARAFEHRIAGPPLRAMRHLPVERTAGGPALAAAAAALRDGELVGIFPEGRVHQEDVGPLRTGAVRLAARAGVPLVPVAVWGGQAVLTRGRRFSLRRSVGAPVVIAFGEPWWPDGQDVVADTADLHAALRALTRAAREATRSTGI